mgnify:CR=1 FL=1
MPAPLFDAHNHLAHPALQAQWAEIETELSGIGLQTAVVNGSSATSRLSKLVHKFRQVTFLFHGACFTEEQV